MNYIGFMNLALIPISYYINSGTTRCPIQADRLPKSEHENHELCAERIHALMRCAGEESLPNDGCENADSFELIPGD